MKSNGIRALTVGERMSDIAFACIAVLGIATQVANVGCSSRPYPSTGESATNESAASAIAQLEEAPATTPDGQVNVNDKDAVNRRKGDGESKGQSTSSTRTFSQLGGTVRKFAILVGVNEFREDRGWKPLQWACDDMRMLGETLRLVGYDAAHTTILVQPASDPDMLPTKLAFLNALEKLDGVVDVNDHVLVAFSGHGSEVDGKPQLALFDEDLPIDEVIARLERLPNKVKLLFCDSCRNVRSKGVDAEFSKVASNGRDKGVAPLLSTESGEAAREFDELKSGLFFYCLNKGLRGDADTDKDGELLFVELAKYVHDEVRDRSAVKQLQQRPEVFEAQIDFLDVPLAFYPQRAVAWVPQLDGQVTFNIEMSTERTNVPDLRASQKWCSWFRATSAQFPSLDFVFHLVAGNETRRTFYISENKVTVEQFVAFADANEGHLDTDSAWRDSEWREKSLKNPNWPSFRVSYFEAERCAKWLGASVPDTEQWDVAAGLPAWQKLPENERAPEGGPFLRPLLEGTATDLDIAVFGAIRDVGTARHDRADCGVRDMAGNGLEWTSKKDGPDMLLRGNAWDAGEPLLFSNIVDGGNVGSQDPATSSTQIGFRFVVLPSVSSSSQSPTRQPD